MKLNSSEAGAIGFEKGKYRMTSPFGNLYRWSQRDISVLGSIIAAKTEGLSKIIFSSTCIHTPAHVIASVNKLVANFVWNGKKREIKRDTSIRP